MKKLLLLISIFFIFENSFAINKPIVILFGPPASGKGFIADKIVQKCNYKHISSGDLLRSSSKSAHETKVMQEGSLLDSEKVDTIVFHEISSIKYGNNFGAILDGYPRSKDQVEKLDRFIKKKSNNHFFIKNIINIECNEEILLKNIAKRQKEQNRKDDDIKIFNARLKVFSDSKNAIFEAFSRIGASDKIINIQCGKEDEINNVLNTMCSL